MIKVILAFALALIAIPTPFRAQAPQPELALVHALQGSWVGVLEYRDYSEPATSTKRETLPTWLSVSGDTWHYIYDDGPTKIIDETDVVHFDSAAETYSESDNGKPAEVYKAAGYNKLVDGRGTLLLYTHGSDNGKPSDRRTTITIDRNYLLIVDEVRPADTNEPFVFRHAFRLTRATAPALTAKH